MNPFNSSLKNNKTILYFNERKYPKIQNTYINILYRIIYI